jgi:signal transduction histidine kinase
LSNAGPSKELQEIVARLEDEIAALRGSRRRLAAANHSERRAIERDLHDGVQQHIVALGVNLQRLAGLLHDRDAAKALVTEMRTNIREALDDARRLATRAYPPITDGRGLAAALRSVANEAGVAALVEVPAGVDYPPEITAALYWTWADAIAWITAGSESAISVLDTDGRLTFTLTVAGQGTERDLDRVRDRIEALDGRLGLEDGQDGSVRLQGWLPLPR